MSPLPTSARASIGLAAITVSAARELPRKLVDLPVIAAGTAIQMSVRVQQRYAELIAKGDEVLSQLHGIPEEPPSWATFDETDASGAGGPETAVGAPPWQEVDLADALEEEAVAEMLEAEALAAFEDAEADRIAVSLDAAALTDEPVEPIELAETDESLEPVELVAPVEPVDAPAANEAAETSADSDPPGA